ncbi:MAG: phosphate acyltransferase [Bacillota bacterium]
MIDSFRSIISEVKRYPKMRLCVAAAADEMVLLAVKDAVSEGLADPILVGDEEKIWRICLKIGFSPQGIKIVNESNPAEAACLAAGFAGKGEADVLMKGMVNSSDYLRAILRPEYNLVAGNILSHLAVYEVPGFTRLIFLTDGGLNISPDFENKKKIIVNSIEFLNTIGIENPKVALLFNGIRNGCEPNSENEAKKLKEMADNGVIKNAYIYGPMSLDSAFSYESAENQGVDSPVAGKADLLMVSNIEAGNVLGKTIIHFAGGKMAGLVLGASIPVILTSRAETPFGKLSSIAFACYYSIRKTQGH